MGVNGGKGWGEHLAWASEIKPEKILSLRRVCKFPGFWRESVRSSLVYNILCEFPVLLFYCRAEKSKASLLYYYFSAPILGRASVAVGREGIIFRDSTFMAADIVFLPFKKRPNCGTYSLILPCPSFFMFFFFFL